MAEKSCAVICRSLGQVNQLVSGDNVLFATFYESVEGESRLPEDNQWDQSRAPVDEIIFPFYKRDIRFASLSLDGKGVSGYGDYCIALKDPMIRDRASVFEENTVLFVQKRKIVPGTHVPPGYRASWLHRDLLAVAKLGASFHPSTAPNEFASVLTKSTATDSDFIEVHIYGALHRRAIKMLSGPKPRHAADKVLLKSVRRKLEEIGALVEVN